MVRGLYIGASGMNSTQKKMDIVSNNLANIDKTAFKKEETILKSFPELLIHRTNDNGVGWMPLGSFDISPIIGKIGTGVEVNEVYTQFEQGSVKQTKKDSDIALNGKGFFLIQSNNGEKLSRNGAFILNKNGYLVNDKGFPLIGENGPIKVSRNNFFIKENGEVWMNGEIGNLPENFTSKEFNNFKNPILVDRIKLVTVDQPRYLLKEGSSLYSTTIESGKSRLFHQDENEPQILQGFLETSNVKLVKEMVNMIEIQRVYEMNQKSIQTHNTMLGMVINQVGKA